MSVLSATAAALLATANLAAVTSTPVTSTPVTLPPVTSVDPPAAGVFLSVEILNGSGCSPETTTVGLSDDNSEVRIRFDAYTARLGGGVAMVESRKLCQLAFELVAPRGYTYAVTGADVSGDAYVAPGAWMSAQDSIYWAGSLVTVRRTRQVSGPFDGRWHYSGEIELNARVYLPCGEPRYSNVSSEVRLFRGTSKADAVNWASLAPADGSASIVYHLDWIAC